MAEEIRQMDEEIYHLKDIKYLSRLWSEIPSNAIIHKTLPGLGATTCEINSKRHSIIIEPNVPVIEGKRIQHANILGVTEDINVASIIEYLKSDIEFKKIVTTPESYGKVQRAFNLLNINYKDDYFLLFDECEKLTSEIDYRETMNLPIEDFWKFKSRSFITATPFDHYPINFANLGFKKVTIIPESDYYWANLNLIYTYNVLATVRWLISEIQAVPELEERTYCFFINSVEMIHNIIKNAEIRELSNIYCSEKSKTKLQALGYDKVYSSLNSLNTINFFTSRFYSAVDIVTEKFTHVIIVTDCKFAPQTMVHPKTESLQIVGRFRNGVISFMHVTNIDRSIPIIDLFKVEEEINNAKIGYDTILTLYNSATNNALKAVYKEALEKIEISRFVNSNHELDYFKLSNAIYRQQIKNIYASRAALLAFYYENSEILGVEHSTFRKNHKFSDNRYFGRLTSTKKEVRKQFVDELSQITGTDQEIIKRLEQIEREDPLIMNAYIELGQDYIESVNYKESKLVTELIKRAGEKGETFRPVMEAVLNIFKVGYEYFDSDIKEQMQTIYNELDYEMTAKATDLGNYFVLSERKTIRKFGKSGKGCKILSAKFRKDQLGQKSSLLEHFKKCPISLPEIAQKENPFN